MYFQGCCDHGVQLFVKDVFGSTKTKQRGIREATYPDGYPSEIMHDFVDDCNNVVKSFHNHHILKAQLCDLQNSDGGHAPESGTNPLGTIQGMAKTLLASERQLYALVSWRNFIQEIESQKVQRAEVSTTVADERLSKRWNRLAILLPLDCFIFLY